MKKVMAAAAIVAALQMGVCAASAAPVPVLDAGTRLFLTLDEGVSSARGGGDVGTVVGCRVWRDVESRGVIFIKGGTPATCRVDKVKRRNMGGTQGNISIGGVETRSVDGQIVMLSGGYHKEGSGHKAVVWTVGLLLLWPVLFVPGGNAELPPGTVFDVATVNALRFEVAPVSNQRVVDLSGLAGGFDAEFMLDDFLDQPKHDTFKIKISLEGALPSKFVIDNVNGKSVEPLTLAVSDIQSKEGRTSAIAAIGAKALAKHFARGINRFEVAYDDGGVRKAAEVVMDVQM